MSINLTARMKVALLVLAICLIPTVLNLFGVNFGSVSVALDTTSAESIQADTLFQLLAGAMHHMFLEWSAVCLALIATLASFLHYRNHQDITVPVIGMALLSAGLVDGFHILAATRIISASTPSGDFIPFTWAVSRVFNASIMIVGVLVSIGIGRYMNRGAEKKSQNYNGWPLLIVISVLFATVSLFIVQLAASADQLPQTMFINAVITRPFDVLPLALFLVCGALFSQWYKTNPSLLRFALLLSVMPEVTTQLHMAFGSIVLFDNHFNVAHALKIVSYGILLAGMLLDLLSNSTSVTFDSVPEDVAHTLSTSSKDILRVGSVRRPLGIIIPATVFSVSLVVTMVVSFAFYYESELLLYDQQHDKLVMKSTLVQSTVHELYQQLSEDTLYLSKTSSIQMLADSFNDELASEADIRKKIEQSFAQFLSNKGDYRQVSLLGLVDRGRELVTVQNNNKGVFVKPWSRLVQKGESAFFRSSAIQNIGEIYYSGIELQRERGEVILPHQAVLRSSTPIFNNYNGMLFGVLVVTVNVDRMFAEIKKNSSSKFKLYIANEKGDYLYHPNKNMQFGFDLWQRFRMQDDFPNQMLNTGMGENKPYQLSLSNQDDRFSERLFSQIDLTEFGNEHSLKLLVEYDDSEVNAELSTFRNRSLLLGFSLSIVALAISLFTSRKMISPLLQMTSAIHYYENTGTIDRLPTRSSDEIGVLARSFHNLLIRMKESKEKQQSLVAIASESSVRLHTIVNNAPDAFVSIDIKGVVLSFNSAAEKLFGYEESEIVGRSINKLMPKEIADQHDEFLNSYSKHNEFLVIGQLRELVGLRKNGDEFCMQLVVSKSNTSEGVLFTGIIKDINQEQEDKEAREVSVSLLEAIIESTNNGILVTKENGQILRYNTHFVKLWGISNELIDSSDDQKLLNHMVEQLVNPLDFIKDVDELYLDPMYEGIDSFELVNGKIYERSSRPMLVGSQLVGRVWSFRDISDQIKNEKALTEAKNAAEKSAKHKSEFLASMSHEIRTPMNGVLGMIGLVLRSDLNQQQRHYLDLAKASSDALLNLINDILDFSKIEAGKLELEMLTFNLAQEISETVESLAQKVQEKGLEIILDLNDIGKIQVIGDPGRLRQILINLIGNAVKFTEFGEIQINAALDRSDETHHKLICAVCDSGIGIEKEKLSSMFQSFAQVDASTTRKYGGTGLGLAITKQLCELMNGDVSVFSDFGQGSRFDFSIELGVSDAELPQKSDCCFDGMHALIVDDNTAASRVLRLQLQSLGISVIGAHSGKEAISYCNARTQDSVNPQFSMVFIDMNIPGIDGFSLGKLLREEIIGTSAKLLMMTPIIGVDDDAHLMDQGFDAQLTKPITPSGLLTCLARVSGQEGLLAPDDRKRGSVVADANADQEKRYHWHEKTRILLVEDNHVNQVVSLGILDQMGLVADAVGNGFEAIEALKQAPADAIFTLILMDCQMPEMDGYEATEQIRKGSAGDNYTSVPIIAMTANAMVGDKSKCLSHGMDDYMSKPIDPVIMEEKLVRWLHQNKGTSTMNENFPISSNVVSGDVNELVWDKKEALRRLSNDEELLAQLITMYMDDIPSRLKDLQDSIGGNAFQDISEIAHIIKGVAGNLSGLKVVRLADEVESACLEENKDKLSMLVSELVEENQAFQDRLLDHIKD